MLVKYLKESSSTDPFENGKIEKWALDGDNEKLFKYFEDNPTNLKKDTKPYDNNLLNFSIYARNKEYFDFLLKKKVRVRADKKGYTAMHTAVFIKDDDYYMKALVKYGVDINKGNKKVGTPLAMFIDNITNGKGGTGADLNYSEKIKRSEEYVGIFKTMIDLGVLIDIDIGDTHFIKTLIDNGLHPLIKVLLKLQSSLVKRKFDGRNMFENALSRPNPNMVKFLFDNYSSQLEASYSEMSHYMSHGSVETILKVYEMMSQKDKEENFKLEGLLSISGGEERVLALLDTGNVIVGPSFVKHQRVIKIAEQIRQTKSAEKIGQLAAEEDIIELMSEDIQDIFVF